MSEKKMKRLVPDIDFRPGVLDMDGLRGLAQNSPGEFMGKACELIDRGELSWGKVRDVKRLFHTLNDVKVPATVNVMGEQRAIMASAFPLLSGALTVAGINEAYNAAEMVGDQLVTDDEDNKRITTYAAVTAMDNKIPRVDEGHPFPEIGAGEEKYEVRSNRNGRRISITGEMIEENDVSGIVQRVNALGELAADTIEVQTLRRITDKDGSATSGAEPYVLRLNGTATALYNHTANNPGPKAPSGTRVQNNALVDDSDLDNARKVLAAMKNSSGGKIAIPINRCTLLVPDSLATTAWKILKSEYLPGVVNTLNAWGPMGAHRPRLISTPRLDDLSTTAWYLGWFEKQFVRKWKLRMEYTSLDTSTESFLVSRIAFQARIAWDCEIGARDYVYVVQNIAATTAP